MTIVLLQDDLVVNFRKHKLRIQNLVMGKRYLDWGLYVPKL